VVGIANTGTGKTAAFLIPLLHKISQDRSQKALIIAPTRELAAQIRDEVIAFTQHFRFQTVLCIGGANMSRQIDGLRRRPDIVIGTPGRLKDLYLQRQLDFNQYSSIVLDEVDRMLDMGFIRDIQFIVSFLPKDRQSIFFSATLSPEVRQVMNGFLRDPVIISVKSQETALNIEQKIVRTAGRNKVDVLHEILSETTVTKTIIFGRTKHGVERLSRELYQRGYAVEALHGNKSQNQRIRALDSFKRNRVTVLLATDVAARGLDIDDVSHVINYDLPSSYEDYVHRIGRTGRAQNKGVAVSLVE
jgi:ATP-dependent RNA helicase RhlE